MKTEEYCDSLMLKMGLYQSSLPNFKKKEVWLEGLKSKSRI